MTPQELKNSILQLAIQGKLVEQRPEEGTAEELFQKIQEEKQRLIAEKKLKKEKPLPEITEEEKPFEIPESWKWVRFGEVFNVIMGQSPRGTSVLENGNGMEFHQGKIYFGDDYLGVSTQTTNEITKIAEANSILLCVRAPVGVVNIVERKICIGRGLCALTSYGVMNDRFMLFFIRAFQNDFIKKSTGTTFKAITNEVIKNQLFPLPPIAEQKRIVAKIEELLPYLDRYEQAWSKLEQFNSCFPEDMKKSLLQYAIQGKLVEQRPEEGTAEELFAQIQEEKQRLMAEKKLKKEKPLPEITEDEKPFEIPESWKWVRVGEIFGLQAGKNITSANINIEKSEENPYKCFGGNGVRGFVSTYNREGCFALIGRQGALCGNINLAEGQFYATEHAVVVDHYNMTDVLWCRWFLKALNLNQYATATAQPGLAVANIMKVLIPLPPLAEQKRIVEKLEQLLPLCERLK